jgi:outer membrane protein OmpA-like peptidoglycan-associated protein
MDAMFRSRLLILSVALALLGGCALHRPQREPSHAPDAPAVKEPSVPAGKVHAKPAAPQDTSRANPAAPNKDGVAAGDAGYFLDVLQGRLRQALDPAVIIGRKQGSIVLDFSGRIGFADNAAQIDDAGRAMLLSLAKVLGEYRAALVSVRVEPQDDAAIARKLAQQRENAVARVLTDSGISAARIAAAVPDTAARNGNLHVEIILAAEIRSD